jgi:hypothetical protein
MKDKFGMITGVIWLKDVSSWMNIEDGVPIALYNSLYDFINRIPISSPDMWEDKWKLAIASLNNQLNNAMGSN